MRQLPYESGIDALVWLSKADHEQRRKLIEERQKEEERKIKLFGKGLAFETVLQDLCDVFSVTEEKILYRKRLAEIVEYRRIFIYVCYKKMGYLKIQIARFLKKDHTTILYQIRVVEDFLKYQNPDFMAYWKFYLHNSKLFTINDFDEKTNINQTFTHRPGNAEKETRQTAAF